MSSVEVTTPSVDDGTVVTSFTAENAAVKELLRHLPRSSRMIRGLVERSVFHQLEQIAKRTDRHLIDIFRLAILHRRFFPDAHRRPRWGELIDPVKINLRVTQQFKFELDTMAWDERTHRDELIGRMFTSFLKWSDRRALEQVLREGADIAYEVAV